MKISINIMGGLGNQLFQIFTTIAYALRNNKEYIFQYSPISYSVTPRITYWNTLLFNINNKAINNMPNFEQTFSEKVNHQYEEIPNTANSLLLNGYFQSYKYFEDKFSEICDIIKLDNLQQAVFNEYFNEYFQNYITVSLHFRRGDYGKEIRVPLDYYIDVLENFKAKPYKILCFYESENELEIREYIDTLSSKFTRLIFYPVSHTIPDWKQLILMSLCNHNIIANSSFSWWGAYLNKHCDKLVYYPYHKHGKDISDMYPSSWIRVLTDVHGLDG